MKPLFVTLFFDVEDFITPESDDVAKWLAEILTEENAKGTFMIVGEKARLLEQRRRTDVIGAIRKHDVGFHSNFHSRHPTISEYLENLDWNDGCDVVRKNEIPGLQDVERIFGKETSCFTPPGSSYGAQLIRVLGRLGKAYVYSPVYFPSRSVNWYCGALTFSRRSIFFTDDEYCGFDKILTNEDQFEKGLSDLERFLKKQYHDGVDWVGIFGCHPTRVRALEFWDDANFAYGRNPSKPDWKKPSLRSEEEMEVAKKNWRRLARFLVSNSLIEMKTIRELIPLYSSPESTVTFEKIRRLSETMPQGGMFLDEEYSPFEILLAMIDVLLEFSKSKEFRDSIETTEGLGPLQESPHQKELVVEFDSILAASRDVHSFVKAKAFLPEKVRMKEGEVSIGAFYCIVAETISSLVKGEVKSQQVREVETISSFTEKLCDEMRGDMISWTIHRKDLNPEGILKYFRLQLWTLKPATLRQNRTSS